jgi:ATP-dependent Clp protease adaptor protein ClpS
MPQQPSTVPVAPPAAEPPAEKPEPQQKSDQKHREKTGEQTGEQTAAKTRGQSERKELPPFNVILLNDEEHTYPYVVEMLHRLFGHNEKLAYQIARAVDSQGRAIVLTTHRERAEFKRDQIRGFGADPRIASSSCSMSAIVEPAK